MPNGVLDNRRRLCAALRSGVYKQVFGGKANWNPAACEFCALGVGVAIDLFAKDDYVNDAKVKLVINPWTIIMYNDWFHMSFNDIASVIERYETDTQHVIRAIAAIRTATYDEVRAI